MCPGHPGSSRGVSGTFLSVAVSREGGQLPSLTDDSIARWRTRMVSWLALNHALDTAPSGAG